MRFLHGWLRIIEGTVVDFRTEVSFDLLFSRPETIDKFFDMLVCILLQPTKVATDGVSDFRLFANKPGGHSLYVFGGIDVSANFDFDLGGKVMRQ
jgi:hypothetical protein